MLDPSKHHNVIEESENEESHNRSSRGESGTFMIMQELQSNHPFQNHHNGLTYEQVEQNHSIHQEELTPVAEQNKFSFVERGSNQDYHNQSQIGNHLSFVGQTDMQLIDTHSSPPRNSQGKRLTNQNSGQDEKQDDEIPFSLQNFKVQQQSRNIDTTAFGGASPGAFGQPSSGTLKRTAHLIQNNLPQAQFSSNAQQLTFNNGNAQYDDQENNTGKYKTDSTVAVRQTPNKALQIETNRIKIQRHSEEDDDEPSLQSPAPYAVKKVRSMTIQDENGAKSPDNFAIQVPICDSNDSAQQSPTAPMPEALSITKSEQAEAAPTLQSPLIQSLPITQQQNRNNGLDHLTESPSLPTRSSIAVTHDTAREQVKSIQDKSNEQIKKQQTIDEANLINSKQILDEQIIFANKTHTQAQHRSDCKQYGLARKILDINVQDYNNTAKISKEIFTLEGLAEDYDQNNIYSDSKTEREMASSLVQLRSKSQNSQLRFAPAVTNTPADLQAHIESLRMRSSFQQMPFAKANSLSPFQKGGAGHVQPHFESLYQLQMHQNNQLSAFDGTSQYSGALRSGNPLAQSITQLHQPLNYTQQHMLLASTQLDGDSQGAMLLNQPTSVNNNPAQTTGQQYEVLLRERSELIEKSDSLQKTIDLQRKQIQELKSHEALLKIQANERIDDLDDTKQALQAKDKMIQDLKDTLCRQNEQIETLRDELSKSDQKQRDEKKTSDKKIFELRDIIQKQKDDYNKLFIIKEGISGDKNNSTDKGNDQIQSKVKEIYELTVELGSLREENNELKKNVDMQKQDFQDRLKEQRERQDIEYNKLVDELELLKIEQADKLEAAKQKNQKQCEQLNQFEKTENKFEEKQRQWQNEMNTKQREWQSEMNAKQKVIDEKQQVCDLQKEEITQLTNNYRLLNQQLDLLQQQLSSSNTKRESNIIKETKNKTNSNLQLSSRSRTSNYNNQLTNKARSSVVSPHSPIQDRQLDQSPEIMGTKPGKINENTRKNMIMSSEMQEETQDHRGNKEDGVFTPVNLSALDEMGLETRRNPIDTEFSRQQQDDNGRRSVEYQSSVQIEEPLGNINQNQDYNDNQSQNPILYDSLHDNGIKPNVQYSNISQKQGCPQHQLIARESQNSSEWKYSKMNINNSQINAADKNNFQTTQQPANRSSIEDQQNNNIQGMETKQVRSPIPPSTIYHQFRKNQSKLQNSSTRVSYQRPSIQTTRHNNNSSAQGINSGIESSDIGSKLITQRRKLTKQGLQSSQSTAILQPGDNNTGQGSSTQRGAIIGKNSSMNNPLNASRSSGIRQNPPPNNQANSGIVRQHGYRGSSNGIKEQKIMQNSSSHALLPQNPQQPQPKPIRTRPSMMLGGNQTKTGLTLAQPQYHPKQQHANGTTKAQQELSQNKFGQTQSQLQNSACKTARQFMQRSPVPQQRPQREPLQTSRSNLGQYPNQSKPETAQRNNQKSVGKIVRQSDKTETSLSSQRRITRSQRMTEYRKKVPSRHDVATNKLSKLNDSYQEYSGIVSKQRTSKLALRDASNRQMGSGSRYQFNNNTQDVQEQLDNVSGLMTEDQRTDEGPLRQKENYWGLNDKSHTPELLEHTRHHDQYTNHNRESSANYVDSSNCDDQIMDEQPQSQNFQIHDRYNFDDDRQFGAATSREQTSGKISTSTTPRETAPAATARAQTQPSYHEFSNDQSVGPNNMDEMRQKLQSIQSGKAYLEKKIQEYESRLNLMKVKKDRHSKKMKNM